MLGSSLQYKKDCYIKKNIDRGNVKPEYSNLDSGVLLDDYNHLLTSYWDDKIKNFSVTPDGERNIFFYFWFITKF